MEERGSSHGQERRGKDKGVVEEGGFNLPPAKEGEEGWSHNQEEEREEGEGMVTKTFPNYR